MKRLEERGQSEQEERAQSEKRGAGTISGNGAARFPPATAPAGNTYAVNCAASDPANGDGLASDISLTVTGVVPEPSTWALLLAGGGTGVLGLLRRRRRG